MKYYVIVNELGRFYTSGQRFSDKLKDARLFVSEKTAIRHVFVKDYKGLKIAEVEMKVEPAREIRPEEYIEYGNWDYEKWANKKEDTE